MQNKFLGPLVDAYVTAQKARIQWGNRVEAYKRGVDSPESPELLKAQFYADAFERIETQAFGEFLVELEKETIWGWLKKQKGIKETLAAKLVSRIDINLTPRVSNLWSLAGFSVVNGHAPKLEQGKKRTWDGRLKAACWLVARSFMLCNSPYRVHYDKAKEKFQAAHPDWTKLHIHRAATGKMIKFFLSDMWIAWRELEGLPVSDPYPVAILGHQNDSFQARIEVKPTE